MKVTSLVPQVLPPQHALIWTHHYLPRCALLPSCVPCNAEACGDPLHFLRLTLSIQAVTFSPCLLSPPSSQSSSSPPWITISGLVSPHGYLQLLLHAASRALKHRGHHLTFMLQSRQCLSRHNGWNPSPSHAERALYPCAPSSSSFTQLFSKFLSPCTSHSKPSAVSQHPYLLLHDPRLPAFLTQKLLLPSVSPNHWPQYILSFY